MMTTKMLLFCIVLLPVSLIAQTKASKDTANDVTGKLKALLHVAEKAYLQFDKPYYAAGDTMYFKAYVTLGERHQLSGLSSILHIDLIGQNKIEKSIKLQLIDGVAWGDFLLPDSLPKANYRVRAYTQWMRNEGGAAFFERIIPINSDEAKKVAENIPPGSRVNAKADVQFLPEGGNLVSGLRSKIAFKATGTDGNNIAASGIILDDENKEICRFSSTHLGMGYFYLQPLEGKTYTAKITYANGSRDDVKLPVAETSGLILSVNNDSLPKATVRIEANKTCFAQNRDKDYTLLIYSGGIATSVKCRLDSNIITLDIAKRRLHTGVATVTLFSPEGEPLCERLLFVQNYDQLKIAVNSDKAVYPARGKVSISLNVKNRADSASTGHFSVSVVDESKVAFNQNDENTILTDFLLTSDLKGRVEQPNYYFADISDEARSDLDLVMLTYGYRKFEWKQILSSNYPPVAYQPEKGLAIAGQATTIDGRPLAKAAVSLIAPFSGRPVISAVTDAKGNFRFTNLVFMDTARFILQAVNAKGSNSTALTYNADISAPVTEQQFPAPMPADTGDSVAAYIKNSVKQRDLQYAQGRITGKMLKEVKINGRKLDRPVITGRYGVPDYTIHGGNILFGGSLTDRLEGRIPGVFFAKSGIGDDAVPHKTHTMRNPPPPMRIIVDGSEMPAGFSLNSFSPGLIDKIEIMTNATVSDLETEGVIFITLKHGLSASEIPSKGILPITAIGFYKAREFYNPKYEGTDTDKLADLRTTIYWNPEVITDKDGNATFSYYNADGTGRYRVVIEGIDNKGNLGRQVYYYKVE